MHGPRLKDNRFCHKRIFIKANKETVVIRSQNWPLLGFAFYDDAGKM
ncbi:hypothetical protein D1AOALGA4SA_2059 [Olavius algarvensis Delta 1 endosymbiont]|nr:hypothetical protein D1AOALGA4SA_2059 [Olavius algarvensis Delta 1 endosymbiont]